MLRLRRFAKRLVINTRCPCKPTRDAALAGKWKGFPFPRAMVIQEEADIFGDQNFTWKVLNDIDDIHKIGKWKTA